MLPRSSLARERARANKLPLFAHKNTATVKFGYQLGPFTRYLGPGLDALIAQLCNSVVHTVSRLRHLFITIPNWHAKYNGEGC